MDFDENQQKELRKKLGDKLWRLTNLYHIVDSDGHKIKFVPNEAQLDLYNNLHSFNVILKARQLGFTTFCCILFLDMCLFKRHFSAGIIAQNLPSACEIFDTKIKFAYDNLPDLVKMMIPAQKNSARKLEFANGSSFVVDVSLRSSTKQALLVSEYGKIAARYPEKAVEIKTGAFNTVGAGNLLIVESTAEGAAGEFYDLVQHAKKLQELRTELTPLDPKLFFYPWYKCTNYAINADVSITQKLSDYFATITAELTPAQKAWYVKKQAQQGDYMTREYPSSVDEAFLVSNEGAYFIREMSTIRKNSQICKIPHESSVRVITFWDLGINDSTSIWFMQKVNHEYRFIDYYENYNEGLQHYAAILAKKGYLYERHYLPHDGNIRDLSTGVSRIETAKSLGITPIQLVPRTKSVIDDIQLMRNVLTKCWFDESRCAAGIAHLDNYRKEWDERLSCWKDSPLHDQASHCCDAFRMFATGYQESINDSYYLSNAVATFAESGYSIDSLLEI